MMKKRCKCCGKTFYCNGNEEWTMGKEEKPKEKCSARDANECRCKSCYALVGDVNFVRCFKNELEPEKVEFD